MKTITAALAFAITAVVTSSASASDWRSPNAARHLQKNQYHAGSTAMQDSRASVAIEAESRPHTHSSNPSYDVHVGGRYLGSDPDPAIRSTIRQEGNLQHR